MRSTAKGQVGPAQQSKAMQAVGGGGPPPLYHQLWVRQYSSYYDTCSNHIGPYLSKYATRTREGGGDRREGEGEGGEGVVNQLGRDVQHLLPLQPFCAILDTTALGHIVITVGFLRLIFPQKVT
jgi:hypothetical protein